MYKGKIDKKSLSSIVRALEEYDGCEIDVRLTRDRIPVIFHDARHNGQRLIKTDFKDLKGFLTLDTLIQHPRVIRLINDKGKTLWVEAKEDSNHRKGKDSSLQKETAQRLTRKLMDSDLHLENIRIISFCTEILVHVKRIRKLKIVPYIFSATDHYFPYYNHKTVFQLFQSLRQHMQKTSSAVRITHLPTGLVINCQSQRSQHKNKESALKVLYARLFQLERDKREAAKAKLKGERIEAGWGNQIRSYVLHPYRMVKDHRTDYETGDTTAVLDGELDDFITAYLRHKLGEGK